MSHHCGQVAVCGRNAGHRGHHGGFRSMKRDPRADRLTKRELEILKLRAIGLTANEIAHQLGISVQTIKNHTGESYLKLGVPSIIHAFIALGWMEAPTKEGGAT